MGLHAPTVPSPSLLARQPCTTSEIKWPVSPTLFWLLSPSVWSLNPRPSFGPFGEDGAWVFMASDSTMALELECPGDLDTVWAMVGDWTGTRWCPRRWSLRWSLRRIRSLRRLRTGILLGATSGIPRPVSRSRKTQLFLDC